MLKHFINEKAFYECYCYSWGSPTLSNRTTVDEIVFLFFFIQLSLSVWSGMLMRLVGLKLSHQILASLVRERTPMSSCSIHEKG